MAFDLRILKRGSRTSLSLLALLHEHLKKNFHESELEELENFELELAGTDGEFELNCVVALSSEKGENLKEVRPNARSSDTREEETNGFWTLIAISIVNMHHKNTISPGFRRTKRLQSVSWRQSVGVQHRVTVLPVHVFVHASVRARQGTRHRISSRMLQTGCVVRGRRAGD